MARDVDRPTIIGEPLPHIPWEDRPRTVRDVLWRSSRNPIIPRDLIPCSNSIFNSAVVAFDGAFAGVFRCDDKRRHMRLHSGRSRDGVTWEIEPEPIRFVTEDPERAPFEYGYDPRVCRIEDRYYVTWCNGYVYSAGAALLDLDEPWKVRYRAAPYILAPQEIYECVGDVPNVAFPCAALTDAATGRIAVYYGGADTVTCLAFTQVDELIAFIKANADE